MLPVQAPKDRKVRRVRQAKKGLRAPPDRKVIKVRRVPKGAKVKPGLPDPWAAQDSAL